MLDLLLIKALMMDTLVDRNDLDILRSRSVKQKVLDLLETSEILSDREFMSDLREGIRQADLGQTISLEVIKLELGCKDDYSK
jgi:hypothetical protein